MREKRVEDKNVERNKKNRFDANKYEWYGNHWTTESNYFMAQFVDLPVPVSHNNTTEKCKHKHILFERIALTTQRTQYAIVWESRPTERVHSLYERKRNTPSQTVIDNFVLKYK